MRRTFDQHIVSAVTSGVHIAFAASPCLQVFDDKLVQFANEECIDRPIDATLVDIGKGALDVLYLKHIFVLCIVLFFFVLQF